MDDDVEPGAVEVEKMVRLDDLEPLVHHGRRIDRDLGAHAPVGMRHRLLRRRILHFRIAAFQERAAARGQDDALDGGALLEGEDLEDGVVLAVHRQEPRAAALRLVGDERAGADERLLVGERHHDAAAHRRHGGCKPGRSDDRRHDPGGGARGGLDHGGGAGPGLDPATGERRLQNPILRIVGHRGVARAEAARLFGQEGRVLVRDQRLDLVRVGIGRQKLDRVAADRTGRAENRDPARSFAEFRR